VSRYIPPYNPLNREDQAKDWTDCDLYGHLPPDSLGICGDCGESIPRDYDNYPDDEEDL
jgi:hypothetical protein